MRAKQKGEANEEHKDGAEAQRGQGRAAAGPGGREGASRAGPGAEAGEGRGGQERGLSSEGWGRRGAGRAVGPAAGREWLGGGVA